jgi:hypothetical protein
MCGYIFNWYVCYFAVVFVYLNVDSPDRGRFLYIRMLARCLAVGYDCVITVMTDCYTHCLLFPLYLSYYGE